MRFYALPSWQLVRQVVGDLFVVAWSVCWWLAGRGVDAAIRAAAEPARQTERIAHDLTRQVADAATQAGGVPVVGPQLREPFDGMAGTMGALAATAGDQVAQIERSALVAGWAVFVVPVVLLLVVWVPGRLAFARHARQVLELAGHADGTQLLALRALTKQPLAALHRVSARPVAAWLAGDPVVTTRLADLELRWAGVLSPHGRSRPVA